MLSFSTKKIYRAAASAKQPPTVTVVSAEVKCNRHMTSPIGGSGRCMEMLLRFTSASNTCFYWGGGGGRGGEGIAEGKHDYSTSLTISLRVKFDNLVLNVMDATDIKGWLDLILHTVKKSHFFLIWLRKQVMQ